MKKASEVKFGVEIECSIPVVYSHSFPVGGYHNGIQSPVLPQGWNVQRDGSVRAESDCFACEIVSPILVGESGLIQLMQVIDYLDQINARVNRSCGLHVHIGADGLTQEEKLRVVKLFKKFEPAFYALNGNMFHDRYYNHYCLNQSRWDGSRYQSLNLTNLNHDHFEIRVWTGNLKPEVILGAVYMATSLVSRATNPEKVKVSNLQGKGLKNYMASFIQQFIKSDSMIIPDLDPADLFYTMMKQAIEANPQFA